MYPTRKHLFVYSFLPYTIHFAVPTPARRHSPAPRPSSSATGKRKGNSVSLFNSYGGQEHTQTTSPAATADHEEFFSQSRTSAASSSPAQPQDSHSSPLSDPHSPEWGSGRNFNQPRSRALSPPPASILKHAKCQGRLTHRPKAESKRPKTSTQSPDRSYDSVFTSAPWTVEQADQSNGGLQKAVSAACKAGTLKEKTWVGTLGMPVDVLEDAQKSVIDDKLTNEFECSTVFVEDSDFNGHYSHYCKTILWPVFHYQIPDNPKSKAYEDHSWIYYVKINQAFADKIVKNWKRGDIIWIHDYHLLLVPSMVRKRLPDAQIGFFLHVAFPSSEVFRCLAVRKELLEGMLGANLIGFQTQEYCRHFLQTCSRLLCVEATNFGVQLDDRFVNVSTFPIGIDPTSLNVPRDGEAVAQWLRVIQDRYRGKHLIVARDKLDHVRGVRQKLLAYELFLNKYPEWSERVVLIQVATSTPEQAELDATVSDIVTRINSTHSTLAHQPLVFLKQDISFEQYLALITVADALMITSLREGMNLTSHEFLYCQDGKYTENKHGSLILSEFTGSASVFKGHELSVNPWDYRKCAEAIKAALEMGAEEREKRWLKLNEAVMHHTAAHWFATFMDHLEKVWTEHALRDTIPVPRLSVNKLREQYQKTNRRLFILDYEGTLASYGSPTSIILTSPERTLAVLNDLLYDEKNMVYVMSGRKPEELDRLFGRVPGLGLIAENGCFLKEFGTNDWTELADKKEMSTWKRSVIGILEYYRERTEGSWIEERHCSLMFNYAKAEDHNVAARQAGDCTNHINDACESQRIHAVPIEGAILVEPIDLSKETAARQIFNRIKENVEQQGEKMPEFLLVAGDAREDEIVFRWANKLGEDKTIRNVTTVSVSSRNTEASATLTQGVTGKYPFRSAEAYVALLKGVVGSITCCTYAVLSLLYP
ncbi:MAG: hypothetical protein M1830_001671 [Pleopsidium flavum]|nr:MAG: hypothetical protein M1830_001671 [Pleopsidium flavum]